MILFISFIIVFTGGFTVGMTFTENKVVYKEVVVEKPVIVEKVIKAEESKETSKENQNPKGEYIGEFEITAYDLSLQSCGKSKSHPEYGITASGYSLKGKSIENVKVIAVDPKAIPLGSKVYIEFEDDFRKKYSGVYTARDTGGAIKGNKIDIFIEDCGDKTVSKEAMKFGRVKGVKVYSYKK